MNEIKKKLEEAYDLCEKEQMRLHGESKEPTEEWLDVRWLQDQVEDLLEWLA